MSTFEYIFHLLASNLPVLLTDREMTSGSSSFKVLPSNSIMSPQVRLPLLAPEERLIDNLDNSSDLPVRRK